MWYKMTEIHFRFPYFRLGLERGTTAKEALDVIVALLGEHGQGGNYYEDAGSCHSFQSAYLIVDAEGFRAQDRLQWLWPGLTGLVLLPQTLSVLVLWLACLPFLLFCF